MIHKAHKLGLLTTPYAFNPDEAVAMAKAGASIIVAHMGLTTSGSIGAKTAITLDDSVGRVQAIADAAIGINSEIIVLCHGGTSLLLVKEEINAMLLTYVTVFANGSSFPRQSKRLTANEPC